MLHRQMSSKKWIRDPHRCSFEKGKYCLSVIRLKAGGRENGTSRPQTSCWGQDTDLPEPDDLLAVARVVPVDGVPLPVVEVDLLHAAQHHLPRHGDASATANPLNPLESPKPSGATAAPPAPWRQSTAGTAGGGPR